MICGGEGILAITSDSNSWEPRISISDGKAGVENVDNKVDIKLFAGFDT